MFKDFSSFDFSIFTTPALKVIELNTAILGKVLDDQQTAAKSLLALSEERIKAALAIKDYDSLLAFFNEQSEIAKTSAEELTGKSQSLAKEAEEYLSKLQVIVTDSQEAVAEVVAKEMPGLVPVTAKKPAAKKAA